MSALPTPSAELQNHSQQLCDLIQQEIKQSSGWINFADFMHMALYTPSLGYYNGSLQKFGHTKNGGGDFITAPEITALFSQALAQQVSQVLAMTKGDALELGAGTGTLAADLLLALVELKQLPKQYFILEVSAHLREIQLNNLKNRLPPKILEKVVWLNALPENFTGIILGNEVIDAIPVHLVVKKDDVLYERGVVFDESFKWEDQRLQDKGLHDYVEAQQLPNEYLTEVCPAATALVNSLADSLTSGVILMLDYGFSVSEYYHPQRNQGTLMCHYQHYAHSNPLINIGLQDITAHVNFTAVAEAGLTQGLALHGYCNQAHFLMSCGILDLLGKASPENTMTYVPIAAAVQKLLSPAEMGELFKVIAFTKGLDGSAESTFIGFANGDKSHVL